MGTVVSKEHIVYTEGILFHKTFIWPFYGGLSTSLGVGACSGKGRAIK